MAVAGTGLALGPGTGGASSHREAPLTAANPLSDNTDTYAFVSPDKPDTVTLIANWIPFQDPSGGPNFFPWGADGYRYNIKVDNDGDAKADLIFRYTFQDIDKRGTNTFLYNNSKVTAIDDPDLLFRQTYTVNMVDEKGTNNTLAVGARVAPSHVGTASMPNYAKLRDQAIMPMKGGGKSFVGQADDPFFLDLRIFDLLYGGDLSERGSDTLSTYNVNTIALQVPTAMLTKGGDGSGVIGVWSTTDQQTMKLTKGDSTPVGPMVQTSRLGSPLVNEVVIPAALKDAFNALQPLEDRTVKPAVAKVLDPEVPKLIEAIYGIPAPKAPRDDLFSIFLTGIKGLNQPKKVVPSEMLRLNTTTPVSANPSRLGVLGKDLQGFPNGRRLIDDVVDIELQALEGAVRTGKIVEPLKEGDKVNANDKAFGKSFPYVALPHSGSTVEPRGTSKFGSSAQGASADTTAPSGAVAAGTGGSDSGLPVGPAGLALVGLTVVGAGVLLRRRAV